MQKTYQKGLTPSPPAARVVIETEIGEYQMTTLNAYIVRETEKAVALCQLPAKGVHKPMWIPKSKIVSMKETDEYSPIFELAGEKIRRQSIPVNIEIDAAFMARIAS